MLLILQFLQSVTIGSKHQRIILYFALSISLKKRPVLKRHKKPTSIMSISGCLLCNTWRVHFLCQEENYEGLKKSY